MSKLYLYGASGHAKVIIESAELNGSKIGGLVDADLSIMDLIGYSVNKDFVYLDNDQWIVSIGNNKIRKKIVEQQHRSYATILHSSANLSARSSIGEGTVVMAGVSVNSCASIGKHCIINTNASVDHDCVIEDYVHISPNVALAGNVSIGEGTHVGIGACVIQGVKVGRWCTIGAGAVIICDVPDGATVVGNPGRVIKL